MKHLITATTLLVMSMTAARAAVITQTMTDPFNAGSSAPNMLMRFDPRLGTLISTSYEFSGVLDPRFSAADIGPGRLPIGDSFIIHPFLHIDGAGDVALGAETASITAEHGQFDLASAPEIAFDISGILTSWPGYTPNGNSALVSDLPAQLFDFDDMQSGSGTFTVTFRYAPRAVAEPGSLALLATGVPVLGWAMRRRRSAPA